MAVQVEDFNNSIPDCLTLEDFLYGHTLTMCSARTVQFVNRCLEFV
jgi:hypothetical protein